MRLLFNVADRGDKYEVISINTNEIAYAGMRDDILEVPSWEVYETVARNLNEGKKVYIPKLLDQFLDVSDLVIEELDPLDTAKQTAIIKARDIIYTTRINKLAIAKFYRFFILSHYFADKGIFITDENRESKYLEVINSAAQLTDPEASEEMIANLEEYINLLDNLAEIKNILKDLDKFIESVNEITLISMEELEARASLQGTSESPVDPLSTKMENEFVTEEEAIDAVNNLYIAFADQYK
jgi:hypothetical protein